MEAELADVPARLRTETYEEHLTLLRLSIADAKAGAGLTTVAEAMAEVDAAIDGAAATQEK